MKIRSTFIAICLSLLLALAPLAIQQFTGLQSFLGRLPYVADPLAPAQPGPDTLAVLPTIAVSPVPNSQATAVQHATADLLLAASPLPMVVKSKLSTQPSPDGDRSNVPSQPSPTASLQPQPQSVESIPPTATTLATTLPTPTTTPMPSPTPLPNRVDLQISQSAQPEIVQTGALLTYTIQINNPGPGIAQNVLIRNTLPNGLLFEGAASLSVRWGEEPKLLLNHNQLTGSVRTLKVGGVITIIAPARVRPNLGLTTLQNQVAVTSTTPDEQLANNLATVLVTLSGALPLSRNNYLPVIYK